MASRTISSLASASKSAIRQSVQRPITPRAARTIPLRFYSDSASSSSSSTNGSSSTEKSTAKATESSPEAEKIKSLETKVKELTDRNLYNQAEIQTLSRRITEERQKASDFAISKFALSLLSTSDVLSTALSHVPKPIPEDSTTTSSALKTLVNGVEMTQKAMWKTFEQNGVKKMELKRGETFDPMLHEATFQIPKEIAGPKGDNGSNGGEWESGEVVEVQKEGWMIGNRVLRPAQVGVTQIE